MASTGAAPQPNQKPVTIVCIGMAGSGKTTFMQRLNSHLHSRRTAPYVLNLDPAVHSVPFEPNIDIRDSVNYKEVMRQYNLGPNGGILTSLNLFATKVDQILKILETRTTPAPLPQSDLNPGATGGSSGASAARQKQIKHILVDTPGQIEVFVWSASGDILLGALASSFPTVIAYVIDTPRTASTSTFMSNMLYACSILYKTRLPMILVFNKTDVKDATFAKEWMTDFEAFQAALMREEETGMFGGLESGESSVAGGGGGSGYMGSLLNSMSLMLEEFYSHLKVVGVSSMTGAGVDEFFKAVQEKAEEFERDYKPELERRQKERQKQKQERREKELGKLMRDMNVSGASTAGGSKQKKPGKLEPETISDMEDEDEDDEDMGQGLVEPDEDEEMETEDADNGLAKRYREALQKERESGDPSGNDFSFARFIHQAKMG
ncbi:hypothetical protein BDY21DRAFT_333541 [Lineolata rhizophorae]|uniref:GPN-loop GTPase n=1 Tax=Lineolata rhizophorae TaxID=578093 RepID=A0A6A6PAQ8_9PEZI|nr:hypothetical protein BDY21DRAFT_333541 [Lineolata rhizophorae]